MQAPHGRWLQFDDLRRFARAAEQTDIPLDAPNDAVMADARAVQEVADWANEALLGNPPPKTDSSAKVTLRRQDFNVLRFNQSCMETAIKIGRRHFSRGLGTHANSEIAVSLPRGAKAFKAMVGIDNNYDTQGVHGSVQFSVEIAGKEVYRSRTLRGSDEAAAVDVAIPESARELVLKVDTTPDGPAFDQADWADARIVTNDGRSIWLTGDDSFMEPSLPFSFRLRRGNRQGTAQDVDADRRQQRRKGPRAASSRLDRPQNQAASHGRRKLFQTLSRRRMGSLFREPRRSKTRRFSKTSKRWTPFCEPPPPNSRWFCIGSTATPAMSDRSCRLTRRSMSATPIAMAPTGGRPRTPAHFRSSTSQYGDEGAHRGASAGRANGPRRLNAPPTGPTRLRAGMERTHLVLHPGETDPQPANPAHAVERRPASRPISGSAGCCCSTTRPRLNGRPLRLPVRLAVLRPLLRQPARLGHRGRPNRRRQGAARDRLRLPLARRRLVPPRFPNGVGNWFCDPQKFPNGLKPVGDACHQLGMKFILWFEPERVATDSQIAKEHPEFVFGGRRGRAVQAQRPGRPQLAHRPACHGGSTNTASTSTATISTSTRSFWRQQRSARPTRHDRNPLRRGPLRHVGRVARPASRACGSTTAPAADDASTWKRACVPCPCGAATPVVRPAIPIGIRCKPRA